MSTITLDGASGWLVKAERAKGGVLMLPTIFGVNKDARDYAAALAHIGLSTLIWDPFADEKPAATQADAVKRAGNLRDGPSMDAAAICIDFMMDELRLDSIGTMGFCLGGRYCLMLAAREERISACASIYPTVQVPKLPHQEEDVISRAAEIQCPVMVVYPGRDHITSNDTFGQLQDQLQRRVAPTSILLYPHADHGFFHTEGAANETAVRQSAPQINAFLKACLS
jgi:carboxymethylenebutenolidase